MPQLFITLFGPPQVRVDRKIVDIKRRKALALLAYLAISRKPHSRDALATLFWPEADQSRARAGLRSALWALNQTEVGRWLVVDGDTVSLADDHHGTGMGDSSLVTDVGQFLALAEALGNHAHAHRESCATCVDLLTSAVELAKDDFMAGFSLADAPEFDEWQYFEATSLRQKLGDMLATLGALLAVAGEYETAIPYARRLVAQDPLNESAQRLLIELYSDAGLQAAAWRQYQQCRTVLAQELNAEPSPETVRLAEGIRGGFPAVGSGSGEDLTQPTGSRDRTHKLMAHDTPQNLPVDSSPLIGRRKELDHLSQFLVDDGTRLVTIVGPGGIGKTRLAVAAAAEMLAGERFRDGVFFVAMASLTDPAHVAPAVAEAIGYPLLKEQRTLVQQLVDYLSQRSMLLVLDNFEHLLAGSDNEGIAFIEALRQSAPSVKLLATSRQALNVYGEQRFPLAGLETAVAEAREPGVSYAAARLFLRSARRRLPGYTPTAPEVDSLAAICRLVEGMPLALELAASWMDTLSIDEIAAEIQNSMDFLAADVRTLPDRHRSMQAVFDTSWRALSTHEQEIYTRLAIFRGGFTQEAAREVAGASLADLRQLADNSLLRYDSRERRYYIHELLRQFAAEQLGEATEATYVRYANYFADFLHHREAELKSGRQREALAEIQSDSENARLAFQWAAEHHQIACLERSLVPLALYLQWHGRLHDGEAISRLAADATASLLYDARGKLLEREWTPELFEVAKTLMSLLTWHAAFLIPLKQYGQARRALQQATELKEHLVALDSVSPSAEAYLLLVQSNLAILDDFAGEAMQFSKESLAIYRAAGDEWGAALALDRMSQRSMNQGRHSEALAMLEESLAIRERLGDRRGVARIYNSLGLVVLHIGQIEQSESYLRKSLALYRSLGNRAELSNPLAVLGMNLLFGGKFAECVATYEECWALHRSLNLQHEPFVADVTVTRAKINLGQYDEARQRAEAGLSTYRSHNDPWKVAFSLHNLGRLDLVSGDPDLALARLQESASILQKMNERSLQPEVLFCLSLAHRALGHREQARQVLVQGLRLLLETGPLSPMRFELPAIALLVADQGEAERAVELYAAAHQSSYIANSRWFDDVAGQRISELAATLAPERVEAAKSLGRASDLWETANRLLEELGSGFLE